MKTSLFVVPAVVALLMCGGCATAPTDPDARAEFDQQNDPLEPTNRAVLTFNSYLDDYAIKPAAQAYLSAVPEFGRRAVHNLLKNLNEPLIFANDVLQGNSERAATTVGRFLVNSTVGVGGLFEVAAGWGMPFHSADLGQTFGVWGVDEGPFLVLPLFGPSNPRDTAGLAIEAYGDPVSWLAQHYHASYTTFLRGGLQALDERSRNIDALDEIRRNALDYYASLRSLYRQHRAQEIEDGRHPDAEDDESGDSGAASVIQ